jgi:prolyl-tRNA editing enzyme YbaK/EbsC (Cys-tRNA(Pro) deacylase)
MAEEAKASSRGAQAFRQALAARGIAVDVLELPATAHTADDAAIALSCSKAQIVKSLVFRKDDGMPLLVLASGPNRVNEKAVGRLIGASIAKADADFTRQATGYTIGGIPPLGHVAPIETLIDEDLLSHSVTWAAAGAANAVFRIDGPITCLVPGAKIISVK